MPYTAYHQIDILYQSIGINGLEIGYAPHLPRFNIDAVNDQAIQEVCRRALQNRPGVGTSK
jgi:hypothetical protein